MKEGPDIAQIGALIGDPARANMLAALSGGRALTATELAGVGGITLQTASTHLAKLEAGGLLTQRKQGRHRYFTLADEAVARLIESMMGFAAGRGHLRHRPGPKEPALRKARICYDHLAGDYGVRMLDSLIASGAIEAVGEGLALTEKGESDLTRIGIDVAISDPRAVRSAAPASTGAKGGPIWPAASGRRCCRAFSTKAGRGAPPKAARLSSRPKATGSF